MAWKLPLPRLRNTRAHVGIANILRTKAAAFQGTSESRTTQAIAQKMAPVSRGKETAALGRSTHA